MTYDAYRYVFYGGVGLSLVCLVIAICLFFALRIPGVIGDLSGVTARKAIEKIRNQNTATGEKTYKSSPVNRERGMITDRITPTGTLVHQADELMNGAMATSKLETQELSEQAQKSYETSLLSEEGSNETTILDQVQTDTVQEETFDSFVVEYEIRLLHSDEVIA